MIGQEGIPRDGSPADPADSRGDARPATEGSPKQPSARHSSARDFRAWFRPVIALVMVATAVLGALAAYRASVSEQQTTMLKLRLSSGRMLEISRWVEFAHQYGTRAIFEEERKKHRSEGASLAQQASALRDKAPRRAAAMDLEAQRELAIAQTYNTFIEFLAGPLKEKNTVGDDLADHVIAELRQFGFGGEGELLAGSSHGLTGATKPHPMSKLVNFWEYLEARIHATHDRVVQLSLTVAFFVLALVLLTAADLCARSFRLAMGFLASGVAVSLAATGFLFSIEKRTAVVASTLVVYAFFAALGLLAWRRGLLEVESTEEGLHQNHLDGKTYRGIELFLHHSEGGRSKLIISLIAAAVFLSAIVGYAYSRASVRSDNYGQLALKYQVDLVERTAQSSASLIGGPITGAINWLQYRIQCDFLLQRNLNANGRSSTDQESSKALPCTKLNEPYFINVRDFLQSFHLDSSYGGGEHLYRDRFSAIGRPPGLLYAMSDAYQELAAASSDRATIYLAILSLCAIALYLFGQALGLARSWWQPLFLIFGVVVFVGSIAWAASTFVIAARGTAVAEPPAFCGEWPSSEDGLVQFAADHYLAGETAHRLSLLADTRDQARTSSADAAAALECATAARPLFAMAHVYLARAYRDIDSPQWFETDYPSLPSKAKVREIIKQREQALASFELSGLPPPRHVRRVAIAFEYLLLAFVATNPNEARKAARVALDLLEAEIQSAGNEEGARDPLNYVNLGLANLVNSKPDAAKQRYREALDKMGAGQNWGLVLSAITDLHIFQKYCDRVVQNRCTELEPVIKDIKGRLAAGAWETHQSAGTRLSDVTTKLAPHELEWGARLTRDEQDNPQTRLSVVWYTLEPEPDVTGGEQWGVWRANPALSRRLPVSELERRADGTVGSVVKYLHDRNRCLPPGQYKAEFFLNGNVVAAVGPIEVSKFEAYRSRELNATFCYPGPHPVVAEPSGSSLVRALRGQGFAAQIWSFFSERGQSEEALKSRFLARALNDLSARTKTSSGQQLASAAAEFAGCDKPLKARGLPHKEFVTAEGTVQVIVINQYRSIDDACVVLNSFGPYHK